LVRTADGVVRFKENAIVKYLYEHSKDKLRTGLNEIAYLPFSDEDFAQFLQLLGYSLSGFGEYSSMGKLYNEAAAQEVGRP
jgi:hypothetical protein